MEQRSELIAPPIMMNIKDVSVYLRVHPMTVYRLVRENKLPHFRVGNRIRFRMENIEEMLKVVSRR